MGLIQTIQREGRYLSSALRMLRSIKDVDASSNNLVCDDLEKLVDKYGSNLSFIEDNKSFTFDSFEAYANRVAGWARTEALEPGDSVVVFVQNRLEYVALWFGLSKVGVIPALLNFHLTGAALAHCVNISSAKCAIVDCELIETWKTACADIVSEIKTFCAFGEAKEFANFDLAIHAIPPHRPNRDIRKGIKAGDVCMKMFTSGTTGLPKAAKVTHVRAQNYLRGFAAGANTKATDRMYMVLPLYHATGGLCGVGAAISNGGAVIIRRRFSASKIWDEICEHDATLFMYVGELCRFMLNTPAHPKERSHKLRWIIGNGLRPDVWPSFVSRFNIPHVIEFYGATEGNVSLVNVDGRVGAVGRVPKYLKSRFNCDIIRYDIETDTNVRSSDGFCIRVNADEVGELIGEIRTDDPRFRFDGYETKEATDKKILRNVFQKGDAWFKTGDLMKYDDLGYYYFMDRVGDTFRWKAENVATGEVAAVLSKFDGVSQANVYGVQVKGYDGRAGMAAIVSSIELDLIALKNLIDTSLPHYARPVFLRLSSEADTTSTFKFKKTNLVKAGFNPQNIAEPLYYRDEQSDSYQPLTQDIYQLIQSGKIRL